MTDRKNATFSSLVNVWNTDTKVLHAHSVPLVSLFRLPDHDDAVELDNAVKAIQKDGHWTTGGGAAPTFLVVLVDNNPWEEDITEEYHIWCKNNQLVPERANELLADGFEDGSLTYAQKVYLIDFIKRWDRMLNDTEYMFLDGR